VVSEVSAKGKMEPQKFNLSVIERNLLTKISISSKKSGYSTACTETFAAWCDCSDRSIRRAIQNLTNFGLIEVAKKFTHKFNRHKKVRCYKLTELGQNSKNLFISKNKKLSTKVVQKSVQKQQPVREFGHDFGRDIIEPIKELKVLNIKEKILKKKDLSFCEPKKSKEEILIERYGFAKVQAAKEKLQAYEKRDSIKSFNAYLEKTIENADSDTRLDENYYANKTFIDQRYDFFVKNGFRMAYKSKNVLALDVNGYTETFNLRDSENAFRLNMRWFLEEKGGFVARR